MSDGSGSSARDDVADILLQYALTEDLFDEAPWTAYVDALLARPDLLVRLAVESGAVVEVEVTNRGSVLTRDGKLAGDGWLFLAPSDTQITRAVGGADVDHAVADLTAERMASLIYDVLNARGMTQAEFCRRVGVSAKHMCRVLNGQATALPGTLDYWAFVLGYEFHVELRELTAANPSTPTETEQGEA